MYPTLVRHTRPAVPTGVCYGMTDLKLASTFDDEAASVLVALPSADRLVTSPLHRCRQLAERIGTVRALEPVVDDRLREMDFGTWEGVPWESIPRAELDAWAADFFHARPHGGESVHMLHERVDSALVDYRRSGVSHLLVTHAGVIKAALAQSGHPDGWRVTVDFGGSVQVAMWPCEADDDGATSEDAGQRQDRSGRLDASNRA